MATHDASTQQQPSEFEQRRAAIVGEIGDSLEQVLTQINALNRSLEGIIEIGNEFASVEALWSQFESVMGTTTTNSAANAPTTAHNVHDQQQSRNGDGGGDSRSGSGSARGDGDEDTEV